jgi:hypothetical protein
MKMLSFDEQGLLLKFPCPKCMQNEWPSVAYEDYRTSNASQFLRLSCRRCSYSVTMHTADEPEEV